jgi:uroporphyrinogen-III synthase
MTKATILNTRPLALQSGTNEAFTQYGFNTINLPCIEIALVDNPTSIVKQLSAIKPDDCIIFTSQHAVRYAFKIHTKFSLPHSALVITVGSKTAHVLEQYYDGHIWTPGQQNSEGVIDLLKGFAKLKNIKLISAENGREAMQTYASNNAIGFQQINVYKRQLPSIDHKTFQLIKKTKPLIILATSETTLIHLKILLKDVWSDLLNQKILCVSARIQEIAKSLGFKKSYNMQTANPILMAEKLNTIMHGSLST